MKKITLLLTTVLVLTALFSTFAGAFEMPLRVVVNGEEIKHFKVPMDIFIASTHFDNLFTKHVLI